MSKIKSKGLTNSTREIGFNEQIEEAESVLEKRFN